MGSAGVKIEFKGLSQILAKYQKLPETVEKAISDGINMAAGVVEGSAKRLCPVDTGHLRGSIHVMKEATPNNMKAIVGTNVEYAPYVEFGTGVRGQSTNKNTKVAVSYKQDWAGQSAQPFLAPALRNNKDRIESTIFRKVIEGIK